MIYILVLGGNVLRPTVVRDPVTGRDSVVLHSSSDTGLYLLTVCRKIYAEAVWLPWAYNTFNFYDLHTIKRITRTLRNYQCKSITRITFVTWSTSGLEPQRHPWYGYNDKRRSLMEELPNLRQIHVCILTKGTNQSNLDDHKNIVTQQLRRACHIKGRKFPCGLKFELVDQMADGGQDQ